VRFFFSVPLSQCAIYIYRLILNHSVWRPLRHPVEDCPLAFCNAQTIEDDDLLPVDRVTRDLVFELYYVKHSPRQKWYWLSRQTPDEIAVFVQFDSESVHQKKRITSRFFGLAKPFSSVPRSNHGTKPARMRLSTMVLHRRMPRPARAWKYVLWFSTGESEYGESGKVVFLYWIFKSIT
jgi:hypothetical protein